MQNPGSAANTVFKSYSVGDLGTADTHWYAGFYEAPAAHEVANEGNLTRTVGSAANECKAAHVFIVASAAGAAAGGTTGVGLLTVTGVSITDAGVKNDADSEVILADVSAASTDAYYETSKKWLGQPVITISTDGDRTTYNLTYNYGFCKYEDLGNRNFTVSDFEITGHGGGNETTLDIVLLKHSSTGWTYSAAAFVAGGTSICDSGTDHGTNNNLSTNEDFAYKRAALSTTIMGASSQGIVVKITTAVNNSIKTATIHLGVTF